MSLRSRKITFEWIEEAAGGDIGDIRSIEVIHSRRLIEVTYNTPFGDENSHEGATIANEPMLITEHHQTHTKEKK